MPTPKEQKNCREAIEDMEAAFQRLPIDVDLPADVTISVLAAEACLVRAIEQAEVHVGKSIARAFENWGHLHAQYEREK